jgi:hypothetical protein
MPLPLFHSSMQPAMHDIFSNKFMAGLSVFLAYTIMNPLMEDIQDTFGKPVLYHPLSLWLCIITLVYTQTSSIAVGVAVATLYEVLKMIWRTVAPEPPIVGQLRKLLHRVQNGEALSDNDVAFLRREGGEEVTPCRADFIRQWVSPMQDGAER